MSDLLTQLNGGSVPTLELLYMLTLVALLPSIVIMMTSFTRTIIIISFTRNALGVQQSPPNMVLVGKYEWRIKSLKNGSKRGESGESGKLKR